MAFNKDQAHNAKRRRKSQRQAQGQSLKYGTCHGSLFVYCLFRQESGRLNEGNNDVDYALLGAGVIENEFTLSTEGINVGIQVNRLSTAPLTLLLLSEMEEKRKNWAKPAHLRMVSSVTHYNENIQSWSRGIERNGGIITDASKPEAWPGFNGQYSHSKLLNQYTIREIAKQAVGPNEK